MTFEEILPEIKQGKKAIRQGWGGSELYIFEVQQPVEAGEAVTPYFLIRTKETPALSMFQPTVCDILADDWRLVD
ncbi:hypothetical protein FC83_GL002640 [Agrilactobacillus composti DSM 18527 = JCM 14202]|uniref:Thoeris anti-defense 2-like domain-containing protein n=1 Tax=Agrilactobacillus composti DSM 18527 = JCM 14202 TaxID=1423734 RepID=X0PIE9_9LACO|nr:DUF2829 domain-containing protein [Agrilactobacillus composti]KRM36763.1 hypothetical protein FC83_GL002640 [Agrilactobacillus composti DSM 18527 = JCM 14202]GAF41873.1 hypothetical protein JCM14202_3837 [Agrilactobacillus composti DSM 18527 = JCM 14202]